MVACSEIDIRGCGKTVACNQSMTPMRYLMFTYISSWFIFIVIAHAALAGESGDRGESPTATMPRQQTTFQADAAGQVNPEGLLLLLGVHHRCITGMDDTLGIPSSYVQAGMGIGTTPAYGRANVHVEWLPVIFAKLRLQYDAFRFYGRNSALLSFPSADARFGRSEVEAKEGIEEAGYGNRILIRPTFYAKAGPLLISNQTDLAYFHFTGRGPYFLDWSYETLVKDGDHVWENRTNILVQAWKGVGQESLLIGPFWEITHAAAADLTRRRAGVMALWVPRETTTSVGRPRIFAQYGIYVSDRNREGEGFGAVGIGVDYDLK